MTLTAILIMLLLAMAWIGLALLAAVTLINIVWLLRPHDRTAGPPGRQPQARTRLRVWPRQAAPRHRVA